MRNLWDMMGLDIYLSALDSSTFESVSKNIHPSKKISTPLLCWDVYLEHYHKTLQQIRKRNEVQELNQLADLHSIDFNFDFITEKDYDALVFTSSDQTIQWVSPGFSDMTGYSRNFAIGKKPRFLQGPNTSKITRGKIKHLLQTGDSFRETVINYRKDASEYACELEVYPLKNLAGDTNGFLALEKKVA